MIPPDNVTKEMLLKTAKALYAIGGPFMQSTDADILRGIEDVLRERLRQGMIDPTLMKYAVYFQTAEGQLSLLGLCKWAHYGYPTITMGHRYAAALFATTASEEAILLARPPWPAFVVELPDKLLDTEDPSRLRERLWLHRMLVTKTNGMRGETWAYIAYADDRISLYRHGMKSEELLPPTIGPEERHGDKHDPFDRELTDRDMRVFSMLGRLIINSCIAMSDPTLVRAVGRSHELWERSQQGPKRSSAEPIVRIFQLGKPVQHDFRPSVSEYIEGARRKLSVQTLVRGHFKTQHYGPKNAQIKVIWREPFWRGPEDAPIPLRPHVLGADD